MVDIYYSFFNQNLITEYFDEFLTQVPNSIKLKVLKYRRPEDAFCSLLGKCILKYILLTKNIGLNENDIKYTRYGRPFIDGHFDFNISHSSNLVICAFSQCGFVGVDIEFKKLLNIHDFRSVFTDVEWQNIESAAEYQLDVFYNYWTKKEAILKAVGTGLTDSLAELEVSDKSTLKVGSSLVQCTSVNLFKGFSCAIATDIGVTGMTFNNLSLNELSTKFNCADYNYG